MSSCLPDGEPLTVRPMEPTDVEAILAGLLALSPESFRRRFFTPGPRLVPGMAEALAGTEDRRLTLVAFDEAGRFVAMAEAIRDRGDPRSADLAVVVADAYQRRGIGSRLLRGLCRGAADAGVERLTGVTQVDNMPVLSMLAEAGARRWLEEPGVYGFELRTLNRAELGLAS